MADAVSGRDPASRAASLALLAGVCASLLLLTAGLGCAWLRGEPLPSQAPPGRELVGLALAGRPAGLLSLGLAALLATPALRVAALVFAFYRRREWTMAAVSCAVLLVLALSVLAGRGH